jgi:hypothetical protein
MYIRQDYLKYSLTNVGTYIPLLAKLDQNRSPFFLDVLAPVAM